MCHHPVVVHHGHLIVKASAFVPVRDARIGGKGQQRAHRIFRRRTFCAVSGGASCTLEPEGSSPSWQQQPGPLFGWFASARGR